MTVTTSELSRLAWRTARKSGGSGCVEVASAASMIAVRHSKDRKGPVLFYTPLEWEAFLDGAKRGEFDDLIG